ncbi:phytoene desaturase family protein [Roseibium sp. M-1]
MTSSDAIVIGGGHNGLIAAALLARSGRKVQVLEASKTLGGAACTEEFAPGFHVSAVAHLLNQMHPEVVKALKLESHGLSFGPAAAPTVTLSAGEAPVILHGGYGERLDGVSAAEAAAWKELRALLLRQTGILKRFLTSPPPKIGKLNRKDILSFGGAGFALMRLGRDEMREFMRMILMNITDVADEHLSDDRLKGLLAFDGTVGHHLGPRSPTSLLGLYYRLAGEAAGVAGAQVLPKGGMGAVAEALVKAATAAGVAFRTGAPVGRIEVENGRASSVVLEGGETLKADIVVSALNPKTTFTDLVDIKELDIGFVRKLRHMRMAGNVAKLHLALDRPPEFAGLSADFQTGRMVIAPSSDYVERAFNPAKYGGFSENPAIELTLPSLGDPSLAPSGACVLSAIVQYAPYQLREGWASGKAKFMERTLVQLEGAIPGIRKLIRHADLLTPADIETRYRMPGGHWHHGELQADQMFVSRPIAGHAGYDTPVEGLYLCGAGTHPGGGISGLPGLNAARHILTREA